MSALRGTLLSCFGRNAATTQSTPGSRLLAAVWPRARERLRQTTGSPQGGPCYNSRQQVAELSTLRRGLTGPRSAKVRLPMRGLEEFLEPVKLRPDEKHVTGRSWTARELRNKSFEDLHKLWFVLYKERNMIVTERLLANQARRRLPQLDRREKVKRSMKAIKVVVGERQNIKRALLRERQEAAKQEAWQKRREENEAAKLARIQAHAERGAMIAARKAAEFHGDERDEDDGAGADGSITQDAKTTSSSSP